MSHFLYIHKDLSNVAGVWKVGIAMTPYSAVRARQKFCWNKFHLDYLYFGLPGHIAWLEKRIKNKFRHLTGKQTQGTGANTEMIQIDIDILLKEIQQEIQERDLKIRKLELPEPYSAANSGHCPFGIPSELYASEWLQDKATHYFVKENAAHPLELKINARSSFNELFIVC
jgi:hypothetical protein